MTLTPTRTPAVTSPRAAAVSDGSATSLELLLSRQRTAFLRDGAPSAAVRRNRIDRLIALLTDNAPAISDALDADFGSRPRSANYVSDILGIMGDLNLMRTQLARWMKPRGVFRIARLARVTTTIEQKPLGVVGVIGPWNFPVGLVVQPTAAAFAAGNRVMIKMSEVTPRTSELFARLVSEYFDEEELAVVTGDASVGARFSELAFDHLFFTGSPAVGAKVAAAAGSHLVPVTLELGGKNPVVVARGTNLAWAADRIMAARMSNGGQICLCPDYVFVPRESVDAFVAASLAAARSLFPTVAGNRTMVSIVNGRNFERVVGLIDDARSKGAVVHQAVPEGETLPDPVTRMIAPTILTGVTDAMTIAGEEVFGPVLTVFPFDRIEEVVDYVASRPSPLAAYWYGPEGADFRAFRVGTTSGGMTINDFALHCAINQAPFGGVGQSGSGAYHGKAGFDTFTHRRTIARSKLPFSLAKLTITPPTARTTKILDFALRRQQAAANGRMRRFGSAATR